MPQTSSPEFEKAYNQAVKFLSLKNRSVGELQDKLKQKKYEPKTILAVIRQLEEYDFLNDDRYAQIFVENLKQYKNFGYFGIKAKLLQKKIPTDIIIDVLDNFYPPEEELEVAEKFIKKLHRQGRKSYPQIARSLSSKGFRTEVITEAVKRNMK